MFHSRCPKNTDDPRRAIAKASTQKTGRDDDSGPTVLPVYEDTQPRSAQRSNEDEHVRPSRSPTQRGVQKDRQDHYPRVVRGPPVSMPRTTSSASGKEEHCEKRGDGQVILWFIGYAPFALSRVSRSNCSGSYGECRGLPLSALQIASSVENGSRAPYLFRSKGSRASAIDGESVRVIRRS